MSTVRNFHPKQKANRRLKKTASKRRKSPYRFGFIFGAIKKIYSLIFNKIFAWSLIIFGLILVILPLIYKNIINSLPRVNTNNTIIETVTNSNILTISGEPIKIASDLVSSDMALQPPQKILIPELNTDLKVVEAQLVNGYWEISETTASHGVGSANPGQNGNVVIFAHARNNLFGPLKNIKKNTKIYILTKDRWHIYEVESTKLVNPTEIETIKPTKDETLTLFTCSGFLDSKRLIVTAKPV